MPKVTAEPALICRGVFEDIAVWSGVTLAYILGIAGVETDAMQIRLVSADGYSVVYLMEEAVREENYLAYEWEGQPLLVLHGFLLRAIFPGMLESNWVKWLVEIVVE